MSAITPPASELPPRDAPVMARAKTPRGPGRISLVGIVLALVVFAVGLVGLHDALISANAFSGQEWIQSAIRNLDGLKPQWWAVAGGIVAVLVGLWLLTVALRPRPRTAVALRSQTGVFLRPRDVRKLAARAADDVDGVLSSNVAVTRRAAKLTVTVTGNDGRIADDVRSAVEERLAALDPSPRLKIKTKAGVAP